MNGNKAYHPEDEVKEWNEHCEDRGEEHSGFAFEEVSCDFKQNDCSLKLIFPAAEHDCDQDSPNKSKYGANDGQNNHSSDQSSNDSNNNENKSYRNGSINDNFGYFWNGNDQNDGQDEREDPHQAYVRDGAS